VLLELRVENYAVIDNVAVEFAPGLNLLTGETGAGKSILIDALALLLGEKASADVIRHGAEKAVVSGVFELEGKRAGDILAANGLDAENGEVILRREVAPAGRGRVFVNNQPATVAVLKQLAPLLAAVHAQNESILAFDAAARLALLDAFCGAAPQPLAAAFEKWNSIRKRIAELEQDEQLRLRLVDLWTFQKKEIADAQLEAGEDERLESEKRVLANAEKIYTAAMGAYDLLYERNASAAAALLAACRHLEELARYDSKFQETLAALESARLTVEDAGVTLRAYAENINASPERLAEVEDRLALLDRLKRKYGKTLADVIAYAAEITAKLDEIENKDEVLARLRSELAAAGNAYLRLAREVSHARAAASRKLERIVSEAINQLAMKALFKIEISGADDEANWTAAGFDQVAYLFAANPGEPLRPVEKIASGGELSRVMLAIRATVETARPGRGQKSAPQRTLIFDEIDTGIGGRAAEAVGRKLKDLAQTTQVLCITHLPQIASFADHHYLIEKREAGGRVHTSVRRLSVAERTDELARMLSGAKITDVARRNAEQMLKANA
jgi:DNA repair protein RecN (Recombination protein N)